MTAPNTFDFRGAFRRLQAACGERVQQEALPNEAAPPRQCLAAVEALLLQPELTLHVAAIFRPLLLRVAAGLVEHGERRGSAEAAVALVALLDLAPQCERLVVQYFKAAPAPYQYISQAAQQQPRPQPGVRDGQLARATLRGLQLSPELRQLWRGPSALDLLRHPDPYIRHCAVRCASLTFGLGDAAAQALERRVLSQWEAVDCAQRWESEQALLAAGRAAALLPLGDSGSGSDQAPPGAAEPGGSESDGSQGSGGGGRKRKFEEAAAGGSAQLGPTPGYVSVGGVELPVRLAGPAGPGLAGRRARPGHTLVHTRLVNANLQSLALGLCSGSPVLMEGPPGSGKSVLVEHIAELTGNAEGMVRIHLDDQMDSKSLMGAYVCTARPGEFVWQPGPLTQAVAAGRWVLIEDINLAPAEVLAALVPLLERRRLHIAARAEVVEAAPGFQLLATVTCGPGGAAAGAYGSSQAVKDLLGGLFHHVAVEPPSGAEQLTILGRMFPTLAPLLPHAMATLALFQAAYGQAAQQRASGGSRQQEEEDQQQEAVAAALAAGGLRGGELGFSVGRHLSLRDLAKWCARMATVHSSLLSRSLKPALAAEYRRSVAAVPLAVREAAFVEAADCFCALLGRAEVAEQLLRALCALWAVPPEALEQYSSLHKPAVQLGAADVSIGRATLPLLDAGVAAKTRQAMQAAARQQGISRFAPTGHALRNMERVAVAAAHSEPVLLVGETGTGKTTLVQQIAKQVGAQLVVLNLSQQTDSSDLLGGFRPVQPADAVLPLLDPFADLVRRTWRRGNNDEFLARAARLAQKRKWGQLAKAFRAAVDKVEKAAAAPAAAAKPSATASAKNPRKKTKTAQQADGEGEAGSQGKPSAAALDPAVLEEWRGFAAQLAAAEAAAAAAEGGFAFAFVEGALVRAVREGWWLLLDEVNLAPPEALERIAGLLEDSQGSLVVAERGDAAAIPRHPAFRLFAAMNPATDAGKRDLPAPLRNRFTELWIGEPPHRSDLSAIAAGYLAGVGAGAAAAAVVDFYLAAKAEADTTLQDGAGHKPAYNLRTLCRALEYAAAATPVYGLQRALYDGFAMSFLTQLDPGCAPRLEKLIQQHLAGGASLKALMRTPPTAPGPSHVLFDHFWVETGGAPLPEGRESDGKGGSFVLTPTVTQHLRNLARAVLLRRYPILLQGPTSSGKTSLVAYLAAQTGHTFVRINNHEQTDLQEYLGSYVSDESGRLVFREGLLVQAVRQGHWIVLDELNLAPTEVLEALNRLLDDNRELYVPELQETVRPHPHFMLFATQNPPGIYAGRKTLSRAFRSRFLELHVEDIPDGELATILEKRCGIAPSYAAKLVAVMRELQRRRASSNVFAGRHGFITPRDLFRWAGRGAVGYQALAEDGFAVLGERLRSPEERQTVKEVLQKVLGAKLDMEEVYRRDGGAPLRQLQASLAAAEAEAAGEAQVEAPAQGAAAGALQASGRPNHSVSDVAALQSALGGVVWTRSMSRMYCLLERCLAHSEPALLVGETGTGKTTVCQMAAFVRGQRLHIINCNQHTEVSDFLGGFRPNRHRERSLLQLESALAALNASPLLAELDQAPLALPAAPSPAALQALLVEACSVAAAAAKLPPSHGGEAQAEAQQQKAAAVREAVERLGAAVAGVRAPFEWVDGPLVEAMKAGDMVLVDELNLAEDAVLERLNSVLEPGRSLTLAERGGAGAEVVVAHPAFRLVATMNPGGDYGKKELSPALANRFTSIWVPAIEDLGELRAILESRLADPELAEQVVPRLLEFWGFFRSKAAHAARQALSVRDLLAWAHFITATAPRVGALPAYAHGAHLVLLDGIGLGVGLSAEVAQQLRDVCHAFLLSQLPPEVHIEAAAAAGRGQSSGMEVDEEAPTAATWGIAPFFVERRPRTDGAGGARFDFGAPTTGRNALRVLRALQLRKPILLEGSPGVGKTSLVAAMAKAVGQELVRINLSEQTDMMDLLGADLPVEGGAPGEFAWSDGPLLRAIREGAWVLLDELNLAGQTVLEGLNAVLDHRSEVFIPELGATFRCPPTFRVFAAQNPLQEGGGRKGLPRSFLNRFMRVHVELLQPEDLRFIAGALHPRIPGATLDCMVAFLRRLHHDANVARAFASAGGPWEFNLRDLLRWCELAEFAVPDAQDGGSREGEAAALDLVVQHFAGMLFMQRLRTAADREHAATALAEAWPPEQRAPPAQHPALLVTPTSLQAGRAVLARVSAGGPASTESGDVLGLLPSQLPVLECAVECASRGWMCLLVGPPSAGKTAVVRTLAALCGRELVELPLTSGTDTSDLLGGFEQMEPERKVQEAGREAHALVAAAAELALASPATAGAGQQAQQALQAVAGAWDGCRQLLGGGGEEGSPAALSPEAQAARQLAALRALQQVVAAVQAMAAELGALGAGLATRATGVGARVAALLEALGAGDAAVAGKFEWVDGALTRAIEAGRWVLLDNANLCNPTVLDRLNPLLEPRGELYLNECGTGASGPRVVRPHPDFRLFLALDPRHGEVSRAMRNRGIEIFLLPEEAAVPSAQGADKGRQQQEQQQQEELEAALGYEGIPGAGLPRAMAAAHAEIAAHAVQRHRRPPSLRELKRWARLAMTLASRGWEPCMALHTAFEQVYVRAEGMEEARLVAAAAYEVHCSDLAAAWQGGEGAEAAPAVYRPAAWPIPITVDALASDSSTATLMRDESIMLQHLSHLSTAELSAQPESRLVQRISQSALGTQHTGLAAAALLPGPVLVGGLLGRLTSEAGGAVPIESEAGLSSGTAGEALTEAAQQAVLCLLAAAQVYAERAAPAELATRPAWAAATAQHAEALLLQLGAAAAPVTAQSAQLAARLVQELLTHPLTAALAELHGPLAALVRMPVGMSCLLPVDLSTASLLQPYLMAAGLQQVAPRPQPPLALLAPEQPGGGCEAEGSAGGPWQRVQALGSKLQALRQAVEVAVLMQCALAGADASGAGASATLLQLSYWRFHHPKERARRPAPHPAVDWIYPLLHAIQAAEESLLHPGSQLPWVQQVALQLSAVQEWRWALFRAVHSDPVAAAPAQLGAHFEALAFLWMRLRGVLGALQSEVAGADPALDWAEGAKLAQVGAQLDACLGLAGRVQGKPCLWKRGGRPLLPRTAQLCEGQAELAQLCGVTSVGARGFAVDHRGQPIALAAACISLAALDQPDAEAHSGPSAFDRASAAEAAAASVAADVQLRASLLEGLCLFASGAVMEGRAGAGAGSAVGGDLAEVPRVLAARVASHAEAVAEAALALQRDLQLGQQGSAAAGDESGPEQQQQRGGGGAMTAVPAAGPLADGLAADGSLMEIMPPQLMHVPSCRAMQLRLLALQDWSLGASQLHLMGSGLLCLLSPSHVPPTTALATWPLLLGALRHTAQRAVRSGCYDVTAVAPHQQLAWLLEAGNQQAAGAGSAAAKWQQLLRQSLAHEAWSGFLQGVWTGASGLLPDPHASSMTTAAIEAWKSTMAGPMRLHVSSLTAHATALAANSVTTAVADRTAAVLQLRLAARRLRQLGAAEAAEAHAPLALAAAEWAAAAAVAATTLEAHLPAVESEEGRQEAAKALRWLVDSRCTPAALCTADPAARAQQAGEDAAFLRAVGAAFASCRHPLLSSMLGSLAMPCLEVLLKGTQAGGIDASAAGLVARGRVWALLGLLRLHLAVPPPGADPAAKYALLRQHMLGLLRLRVEPELVVRRQYQALPGGPDESARIAALEGRSAELQAAAEELEGRCVPRPSPPAYLALREEVARFAEGFAAPARVAELVEALASGSATATSQAATWQQNAAAWVERVGRQWGAYRDILQPVQVAVQEVRYGLSLLAGGTALAAPPATGAIPAAVATLLAYPRDSLAGAGAAGEAAEAGGAQQPSLGALPLESSDVQMAVAELAAGSAAVAVPVHQPDDPQQAQRAQLRRTDAARMAARLRLLRVALHDAARAAAAARHGGTAGTPAQCSAVQAAQLRLHAIFTEFVGVWEEIKAEEERRAVEEAELFKTKARSTDIATEEQEDEEDYRRQFPDQYVAFADLAAAASEAVDLEEARPLAPEEQQAQQQQQQQQDEEAQQATAFGVRDLVTGEVLPELVALHAAAFVATPLAGAPGSTPALAPAAASAGDLLPGLGEERQFLLSYELGSAVLRDAGLCLPAAVDGATATGHLMALALRHRQLSQTPAEDAGDVDLQAACVEEAVLVQRPLQAVQTRLGELLEEWPDHPVLAQLSAIAGRVLGMPASAPLKQLLTGLELLLARAQVWEETAAKHVSLAAQLQQVAALASRWRQLELASWKGLLHRTVERFAQGADKAWFHLYRILVCGDSPVAEVSVVVEQFMQACPAGEYAARLRLLHSFEGQLPSMAAAALDAQQAERWRHLGAVLCNVHSYYAQFAPHVQRQLDQELRQLEKELQDFVALAKWEDRGYYAQRMAADKAQRQLHRLSRRAVQALKEPAGAVLAAAARAMGFNDLAAPALDLPDLSAKPAAPGPAASGRKAQRRVAQEAAAAAAVLDAALISDRAAAAAAAALKGTCDAALGELNEAEGPQGVVQPAAAGGSAALGGKYAGQLPRLTRRFQAVVLGGGEAAAAGTVAGAAAIDGLAGEAAERALALRGDTERGARARKKKALTDLLKALQAAGVSRRRTAVPPDFRGTQAWFRQAGADATALLAPTENSIVAAAASSGQLEAGALAWAKADAYYFRTLARVQRLWEAANQPHTDLAPHEVEAACRMSEHLVYLAQRGRSALSAASAGYGRLSQLLRLLGALGTAAAQGNTAALPPQAGLQRWYSAQSQQLARLASHTAGAARLLRAAAGAEPAAEPRALLSEATSKLEAVLARVKACSEGLAAAARDSIALPGGQQFLPPGTLPVLKANDQVLCELHAELSAAGASQQYRTGVPGWHTVEAAFLAASQTSASAAQQLRQEAQQDVAAQQEQGAELLGESLESAVAAALVWAQNARPAEAEGGGAAGAAAGPAVGEDAEEEEGPAVQPIPTLLDSLERRMGAARVEEVCSHLAAALGALAAAAPAASSRLAAALAALAPMLRMLRGALCQLGLQYLAAHKASAKLGYVAASLFAGLVQEGFCMPQGEPVGEGEGGEGKLAEGTGLGEGDTRGAKDISEQLEDQDQLLGAKQKGGEEEEEEGRQDEQQQGEQQKEEKGVEMDEDFEGSLEDVQRDPNAPPDDEEGEEGEEEDRLDQQMGEAGPEADAVDERLWDEEDREQQQGKQEEAGYDEGAVGVEDKSQLDYAQGQDQPEEEDDKGAGKEAPKQQQQQQKGEEGGQPQPEEEGGDEEMGEGAGEEEEEYGDYPDRQQEQQGQVQPEGAEPEFELPEDLNLDGGEEEGGPQQEGGEQGEEEQQEQEGPEAAQEQGGAFPEDQREEEGGGAEGEGQQGEEGPGEQQEGDAAGEEQPPLPQPGPQAGEGEGEGEGEEEPTPEEEEGGELAEAQQGGAEEQQQQQQAPAEAGPKGLPSAAAAAAAAEQGAGEGEGGEERPQEAAAPDALASQPLPSGGEAPPDAGGSAAGAAQGMQRDASAAQQSAAGQDRQAAEAARQQQQGLSEANPYRNLGSALERWRARLAVTGDAPEAQQPGEQQEPEVLPAGQPEEEEQGGEAGGEYRFLGQQEGRQQGDTQALAPATEEQAAATSVQRGEQEQEAGGLAEEEEEGEAMEHDATEQQAQQQQELATGQANWGAGAGRKAGLAAPEEPQQDAEMAEAGAGDGEEEAGSGEEQEGEEEGEAQEREGAADSYVTARLAAARLEDEPEAGEAWELVSGLSEEAAQALRDQLDERLKAASEGVLGASAEGAAAHGREVWARCEALTGGLVGELAEQLRLILEPTLASRLAGDYRTGKRINMKKVIGYIASHFRKDKIWLRRTRPDKRRYQVVVAIDDSRSMAETGTGGFALEALTLICRAMARLEVGELGVVSFGGSGGVQPLHALERPFTDADGARIMAQMRFDQDNTITDRPMVDVLTSLSHILDGAAARGAAGGAGGGALHQLVLIIADGRFHEKESLRRMVREATSRPGVLYAFIVLDNPANSILDMQTVSFVGGKPVFAKYMDSFPFPLYIVLRDTAALPRTLADLIRQWFELSSA